MRTSPLTRPAKQLLQGRLQLPATSPVQHALMRSRQIRWESSQPEIPSSSFSAVQTSPSTSPGTEEASNQPRYPRNLQALHLQPLRREAQYGIPSCDLQLRAYSARPLEFFCDFALRAAYYLGLPAFGPVPLPRIVERWTVPRSSFIFKKSQENFERITLRRLLQIRDGHPETVQIWLAFLQKHAYPGIGMKANMWEFGTLDVGKELDETSKDALKILESKWSHLAQGQPLGSIEEVEELLASERMRVTGGR